VLKGIVYQCILDTGAVSYTQQPLILLKQIIVILPFQLGAAPGRPEQHVKFEAKSLVDQPLSASLEASS